MGLTDQKLVMDVLAWGSNVSTSVMIIFVNKILMNATGYGFRYGKNLRKVYTTIFASGQRTRILHL